MTPLTESRKTKFKETLQSKLCPDVGPKIYINIIT